MKLAKINIEPLVYWMKERHKIYKKKTRGSPKPWTSDLVLQANRFCNVYRELDTVTAWLRENWREPYAERENLWFAMVVARCINLPDTLAAIGFPKGKIDKWLDRAKARMKARAAAGLVNYTAAYMITCPTYPGIDKPTYTIEHVLRPMWHNPPKFLSYAEVSLQDMWRELVSYFGMGPFLAYEIVTDLRWTRYYIEEGGDHLTWANAGPGALRGLSRLWDGDVRHKPKPKEALERMQWLLAKCSSLLPASMLPLEMRDIEHSLCETDKYLRVKNGEGRAKQRYKGQA